MTETELIAAAKKIACGVGGPNRDDVLSEAYLAVAEGLADGETPKVILRRVLRVAMDERDRQRLWYDRHKPLGTAESRVSSGDSEMAYAVHEALLGLTDKQREVVQLHYWEGMSEGDIATELNTTVGAIEQHLFRARKVLREILSPQCKNSGFNFRLISECGEMGNLNTASGPTLPRRAA